MALLAHPSLLVCLPLHILQSPMSCNRYPFATKQPVEPAIGTIGLIVAADFVDLLAAVADEFACLADAIEFLGEL